MNSDSLMSFSPDSAYNTFLDQSIDTGSEDDDEEALRDCVEDTASITVADFRSRREADLRFAGGVDDVDGGEDVVGAYDEDFLDFSLVLGAVAGRSLADLLSFEVLRSFEGRASSFSSNRAWLPEAVSDTDEPTTLDLMPAAKVTESRSGAVVSFCIVRAAPFDEERLEEVVLVVEEIVWMVSLLREE